MADKTRWSARTKQETLDLLDDISDETGLSRSNVVTKIVEEWHEQVTEEQVGLVTGAVESLKQDWLKLVRVGVEYLAVFTIFSWVAPAGAWGLVARTIYVAGVLITATALVGATAGFSINVADHFGWWQSDEAEAGIGEAATDE